MGEEWGDGCDGFVDVDFVWIVMDIKLRLFSCPNPIYIYNHLNKNNKKAWTHPITTPQPQPQPQPQPIIAVNSNNPNNPPTQYGPINRQEMKENWWGRWKVVMRVGIGFMGGLFVAGVRDLGEEFNVWGVVGWGIVRGVFGNCIMWGSLEVILLAKS